MPDLIQELKKEHKTLLDALEDISKKGLNNTEAMNRLSAAREGFIIHLKKEESELYPRLYARAESDKTLKRMLELFDNEMSDIGAETLAFFSKYSRPGSVFDFNRDMKGLCATLGKRLRREEKFIYEEYEKLGC